MNERRRARAQNDSDDVVDNYSPSTCFLGEFKGNAPEPKKFRLSAVLLLNVTSAPLPSHVLAGRTLAGRKSVGWNVADSSPFVRVSSATGA